MCFEVFLELLAFDLVDSFVDALNVSELFEQFGRGLWTDGRHTFDVVGAVAGECEQIADLVRPDTELRFHFVGAVDLVSHRVPHRHGRAHELREILVRAHDDDAQSFVGRAAHRARYQVVRLKTILLPDLNPERLDDAVNTRHLQGQILGRRRAIGLVGLVDLLAERTSLRVHGHRQELRIPLVDHAIEHAHGAVGGMRWLAAG